MVKFREVKCCELKRREIKCRELKSREVRLREVTSLVPMENDPVSVKIVWPLQV